MKTKRITEMEIITGYRMILDCLQVRAFRLLGIGWTKWVRWWMDARTGDVVFEYE